MRLSRMRLSRLMILGASGHGKVVADCAAKNGYREIVFLDDAEGLTDCGGWPVVGKCADVNKLDGKVIVAIGNAGIRRKLQESVEPARLATLIHPAAVVSRALIGPGSVVLVGAVVNPGAEIGAGCILNTCCSVDHDCQIGDYAHIAVGAHVAGGVTVGDGTWIGAGAVVSNNIRICGGCMIGAGAAVVKDICETGTYVGVPARKIAK